MSNVLTIDTSEPIYTFAANHPPRATVTSGTTVRMHTLDSFSNRITHAQQKPSDVAQAPRVNPLTGPIVVAAAKPGDGLAVRIDAIEPTRDFAVTALVPNFGGLTRTDRTAMLHEPLPDRTRLMPIRDGQVHFNDRIALPLVPFVGTMGVAPDLEAISSLVPDRHGGNLDCVETQVGRTVVFPVQSEGAHFFLGDVHATQGDGEISGVAAEIPAAVTVTLTVLPGGGENALHAVGQWPRIISDQQLMVAGSARPLEDAARIAWCELIDWLASEYGFDRLEAYELLGQVGQMRVGNIVDPNYTMVAKIDRRYVER